VPNDFIPQSGFTFGSSKGETVTGAAVTVPGSITGTSTDSVPPGNNTPEPATLVLGLLGVAGAAGIRRRKAN
jgi:hypothetical protein